MNSNFQQKQHVFIATAIRVPDHNMMYEIYMLDS